MKHFAFNTMAVLFGLLGVMPAYSTQQTRLKQHPALPHPVPSASSPRSIPLSAEALIARAIAAEGGAQSLQDAAAHQILEGDMEVRKPFLNTLHLILYRKKDKMRMEFRNGPLSGTFVLTGTGGWKETLGSISDLSPEETNHQKQSEAHRESLLLDVQKGGYTLKILGKNQLPDAVFADVVRVVPMDGAFTDFYFAPQTGRIAAIGYRGRNTMSGRNVSMLERFVPGKGPASRRIHGELRFYEDGELTQTIRPTRMDTKSEIDDALFTRPDATRLTNIGPVMVPFDFSTGELILEASINGKAPRKFMVDTGAGITLLVPKTAKEFGLTVSGKANMGGGGGAAAAQFARLASLGVGAAEIKNISVAIVDLGGINALVGDQLAGVLGYNFLSQFQLTLDYGTKQLTLAPKETPLPAGVPVQLDIFSNIPLVDAEAGGKKFRMMVDTGAMWTILPPRVAPMLHFERVTDGAAALGIDGSPVFLKTARLSSLSIGGQPMEGTLVSFAPPAAKSTGALLNDFANGILGNTFLRRFRVTLDYARQKAVFVPLPGGDPYPDDWTHPGLLLAKLLPNSNALVARIMPGSPAAQAGLEVMDTITEIDDKPTIGMSMSALANALRGPAASTVRLKVVRNGKPKTYVLKRVRLL